MIRRPPRSPLFPSTTLFRSLPLDVGEVLELAALATSFNEMAARSEEHTSELQSRRDLVCRLLLEKKQNEPSWVVPGIVSSTTDGLTHCGADAVRQSNDVGSPTPNHPDPPPGPSGVGAAVLKAKRESLGPLLDNPMSHR